MCVTFFRLGGPGEAHRLVLAFNRDEEFDRPAAGAHWWPGAPNGGVLGGRDLVRGGTWLGMTRSGRLALLTNVREPPPAAPPPAGAPSRGSFVARFLLGVQSPEGYVEHLKATLDPAGSGFNLVCMDLQGPPGAGRASYLTNRRNGGGLFTARLRPGATYGLSNAGLDVPWPKVEAGKAAFEGMVLGPGMDGGGAALAGLLDLLRDARRVEDPARVPVTGVPPAVEQRLSGIFVEPFPRPGGGGLYGTRTSTAVTVAAGGDAAWLERDRRLSGEGGGEGGRRAEREIRFAMAAGRALPQYA